MKHPHHRTGHAILALILALSLNTILPTRPVAASDDAARWANVNIPAAGQPGDWVLADGSDVQHLHLANDGTLYAYGKGLGYTLYRSTDGGDSWSQVGRVRDAIVGIAISPHDANTIYYATAVAVYRSTDGGETFYPLPEAPGGAGSNNIEITCLDVSWLDYNVIAVGTRDTDGSQFGGIYTLSEDSIVSTWTDTGLGSYDVYALAFSPAYTADRQLVAVITDETDTLVSARTGDAAWGASTGNAILDRDNSGTPTPVAVASAAAIAFPDDYGTDAAPGCRVLYIAIATGTGEGDVYKISEVETPYASTATDLNAGAAVSEDNIDIAGLTAYGDTLSVCLLAGAAASTITCYSADGGSNWSASRKQPTGESCTGVLAIPEAGLAYAATSGDESAFSVSHDNGTTWDQVSLIDTEISTIVDLAPSPNYQQDKTLFLLTFGGKHSLWRSSDGGDSWARIFSSALDNVDSISRVALPPQYTRDTPTVFLAGESGGWAVIWKSTDNGRRFIWQFPTDPDTGAAVPIDTWAVADNDTLLTGSYNGSQGMFYRSANSGFYYARGTPVGGQPLNDVALSPGYAADGTILIGNASGWVYLSDDNGASFEPLPADATSPPLEGNISVAFDPQFGSNRTVYAASDTADSSVYRFIIGTSTDWESIDGTLPDDARLNSPTLAGDGTLYAANADGDGGLERCLNPAYRLGPTFTTVTGGLGDGATLAGLWSSGHRLWASDTANARLMTFDDTLTGPVMLTAPADTASGSGSLIDHTIRNVSLDWEPLEGATGYQWQLDHDTDFSSVPTGFEGNTTASSTRLPTLEPATTYYWRVRASTPVPSPWSEKRSFTTSLDTEEISLRLQSPEAGASGVPVKPVFQWTAVAGADAYELLISPDASFSSPCITKTGEYALPATAWQCDLTLDYATTYYWKVRAVSASTRSAWSASGAFTTEAAPEIPAETDAGTVLPPLTPAEPATPSTPLTNMPSPVPTTPQPSPTPIIITPSLPDWAVYIIVALLLAIVLTLVIILTLVIGIRR